MLKLKKVNQISRLKLYISLLIFTASTILNIFFSTVMHYLLSTKINRVKLIPINECLESIVSDNNHLILFLCLQSCIVTICIFTYFSDNKPYQSSLRQITPKIKTPVPVGQNQHGSAEWMKEKEKDTAFDSFLLNQYDNSIKSLIACGYDDLHYNLNDDLEDEINTGNGVSSSISLKMGDTVNGQKKNEEKRPEVREAKKEDDENKTNDENKADKNYIEKGGVVIGCKKLNQTLNQRIQNIRRIKIKNIINQNAKLEKIKNEKLYFIGDDVHTLCIGATRSGKSRTVVLQSICTLALADENIVISDPKGELYQYTYPYLQKLGYKVITIDFKNPLKSNRYNFLQQIIDMVDSENIPKAIESAWDLTASLVGEPKGERIWTDGEASIIASSIMCVVYDNREKENRKYQNMTNVYSFIAEMTKNINGKMPLIEYINTLEQTHPARALLAISEVAPSKTRGSFYTAALTTLRLFTNPLIYSMTSESDYDIESIAKNKTALFIVLPDEKTTYYSLASLLVSILYEKLVYIADNRGGRLLRRVNFILDEYGNFTKIPDFANKLTVGGGRGIRFNLFVQSIAQIDDKYGKETSKTIRGNCQIWIYLQADDIETLEEISKKLGNYTTSTYSLNSSNTKYTMPSSSHSISLTARALLTIDEVRLISRPYLLITSRDNPAIMYAPDISNMIFNKMLGLGDKEYNRKLREIRESRRKERNIDINDIELWNIWLYFISTLQD